MLQFFTGSSKNRLELGANVEFQHPVSNSWTNGLVTKDEGDSYYSIQTNDEPGSEELHVHIHMSKIKKVAYADRRSSFSLFSGSSRNNSAPNNATTPTSTGQRRGIRSLLHITETDSTSSKPVSLKLTKGKSMSKSIRDLMPKDDQFVKKIPRRHIENEELVILERVRKCNQSGRKALDISKLDLDTLPEQFQILTMITELTARRNHFTSLQPLAVFSKLVVLDVSFNLLGEKAENDSEVFEAFSSMRQLTSLDLSNNSLTYLPSSLVNLAKLERLTVRKNKISVLPTWFADNNMKNLSYFDCSHNLLTEIPSVLDFICVPVGKLVDLNLDHNPCMEDREVALSKCAEKTRFLLEKHSLLVNRSLRKELVQRATHVRNRVVELEQSKIMADAAARDPVVAAHLQHH